MSVPRITVRNLYADLAASVRHFASDPSAVEQSRARVEAALSDGELHYGVNTGFGALARERVPLEQLSTLQRNLLLSHAVGVGDPVPPAITRLMLRLKIYALGLGYSGVSLPVFQRLIERVPNNFRYRGSAAEAMLSLRQPARALRFAEEGVTAARQANDRDSEQYLLELAAAAKKQLG